MRITLAACAGTWASTGSGVQIGNLNVHVSGTTNASAEAIAQRVSARLKETLEAKAKAADSRALARFGGVFAY
jgi:hypothetical protein